MSEALSIKKNVTASYVWRQVYYDGTTRKTTAVDMRTMTKEHINKAALKCQLKIAEHYEQANGWQDLLDKLETVAAEKGFEVEEINNATIKHDSKYKKGILARN